MSKNTKIWLITAASLILIGGLIFTGVMTVLKWDFRKLSTTKYQTNEHKITESFKNISIVTDTADIDFVVVEEKTGLVVCVEEENAKHQVSINDETLEIKLVETKKWYQYIGINFGSPKITVYVPAGEYGLLAIKNSTGYINIPKDFTFENIDIKGSTGDVTNLASAKNQIKIKRSTGAINIVNVTAQSLDLSVSTGKITVSDVKFEGDIEIKVSTGKASVTNAECKNLSSIGNTGNLKLKNAKISEKLSLERSTGDIRLELCDAGEITIKTDTGGVTGTLLSDKVFITNTDTGDVEVPKTVTGGKCEITTDTGDIKLSIKE